MENTDVPEATALSEEFYNNIMDKDNITKQWLLLGSPYPVITILSVYLLIILKLGPQFMKTRPPYDLQLVMRFYDIVQVIYNGFIIHSLYAFPRVVPTVVDTICATRDPGTYDDLKPVFLYYAWHYLVLKIVDLLDTVFMVLRKKYSHVTFLHVYHHMAMVFFTWLTLSYTKSHHAVAPVMVNIVVHIIMYSYYFLATFPQLKQYLWWKRHLTKLQLGQFVVVLLYISFIYYNGCTISRVFTFTWVFNVFVILILFINFYIKAYFQNQMTEKMK
uniref:Elongation of very long chain fatty acids protein n=1 Tax=Cuerna arida TaxID=1464854 RepID=A0A1B6FNM4_9HEMI